jgi:hypothetical protein
VDWNRNGIVEDDPDDPREDTLFRFVNDDGALVLVNCDRDARSVADRDLDDDVITNELDAQDMSPVSLELERDLRAGEELWIRIELLVKQAGPVINIHDLLALKNGVGGRHILVGHDLAERRLDNQISPAGDTLFPDRKKRCYDGRFLIEGLQFARYARIHLEIRLRKAVVERDEVLVLATPWLANHNLQPLADPAAWSIPGNLVNSKSYLVNETNDAARKAKRVVAGDIGEWVQDTVEWGYQVRRQKPADKSRTMITALRLAATEEFTRPGTFREDRHPDRLFKNEHVGVWGYNPKDLKIEDYYKQGDSGDQGGNLECLPPSAGFPFGRILIGDTMTNQLRFFLRRQDVQDPVSFVISHINLAHIDEVMVVVPAAAGKSFVMTTDWTSAKTLISQPPIRPREHSVPITAGRTYDALLNHLANDKKGQQQEQDITIGLSVIHARLEATIAGTGLDLLKLPGMYLDASGAAPGGGGGFGQRPFPRNIANSLPTVPGVLTIPEPPQEVDPTDFTKRFESSFLKAWKDELATKRGFTVLAERHARLWLQNGDVHCVTNAIREPIKK